MAGVTGVVEIMMFVVREIPVRKGLLAARKANVYPADGSMHRAVRVASVVKGPPVCRMESAINVVGKTNPAAKGARVRKDLPAGRTDCATSAVGQIYLAATAIDAWKATDYVDQKAFALNAAGLIPPAVRAIPAGKATFAVRMAFANYVVMRISSAVTATHVRSGTSAPGRASVPHVGR